jgi:molybdate transport system ATP-binding protein
VTSGNLHARLHRAFGSFQLNLELDVRAGETLVVVGESGAGKSTLLRLIAGLERPDDGTLSIGPKPLFDSRIGLDVPVSARPLGYVPQDYALFPHLTVFENIAFGLGAAGCSRREKLARANESLARAGISEFAGRRPRELSGGQQQRVALARALVLEPEILLLDEPLSALDLRTRQSMRGDLRRTLAAAGCVTLYVTHHPIEAVVFGDRIAALESGRITQVGTRDELLRRPRSPYVAAFLGVNLFQGSVTGRDKGVARVRTGNGEIAVSDPGGDGDVFAVVNPRDISLFREAPEGSARNCFRGEIAELAPEPPGGERIRVLLRSQPPIVAEITDEAARRLGLYEGLEVYASFKATGVEVFR